MTTAATPGSTTSPTRPTASCSTSSRPAWRSCARPSPRSAGASAWTRRRCCGASPASRRPQIVRQLSAIFDTRALGYTSSLVAASYPDDRLFEAANIVGGHPGVSHNYRRTHAFNLWYTLACEPDSRLGLEETMQRLHEASGAESTRLLPTLKLYKINVQLDMTGTRSVEAKEEAPKPPPTRGDGVLPTEADKAMIAVLQRDLPIESEPFDALGRRRRA